MTTHRFSRRLSGEPYDFEGPATGPQTLDDAQAGTPAGDDEQLDDVDDQERSTRRER